MMKGVRGVQSGSSGVVGQSRRTEGKAEGNKGKEWRQVEAAVGKSETGTAWARKTTGASAKGRGREGDSADKGDDACEKGSAGERARANGQR